jgi:hypothetical protein
MRARPFVFLAILAAFRLAWGQASETTPFKIDSYALAYPSNWTYKLQPAPDGSQLHMFFGPQQQNAMPYCHATQQPLNPTLAPRAAKMNDKQRAEFFLTSSDQSLLFSLYGNLASAQGFRLIHTDAVAISQTFPAFTADFVFRTPQGFVYRVRSHYTFWRKAQLSVWCQTVSRSEPAAEDLFLKNLATFQRFIASIRISP